VSPGPSPQHVVLDREEALVVAAATGRLPASAPQGLGREPVRWQRVVDLARWHRVSGLVWELLRDRADELGVEAPSGVQVALRSDVLGATARSLNLQFELDRILRLLEEAGIRVMLLKGAALVEAVYAHPGLRPMVDLDLLVEREHLEEAHATVASALGYDLRLAFLERDDEQRLTDFHHHFPLVRQGGALMVELHHRLIRERPEFVIEGLWDRAQPGTRPPAHVLPAPEDLALHIAVHFAFDRINRRRSGLAQLADFVRVAERWELDWPAMAARARSGRVADPLFLALVTCEELVPGLVPTDAVDAVRPATSTPDLGAAFVRERVVNDGPSLPLEQLQRSVVRRIFPGRAALEVYVRIDEPRPSLTRLRGRRWLALVRRVMAELPGPRAFLRDARLSRWISTLQD
jgi:hypothetical protein